MPIEHYNAAKIDNYPNKEYGTISTCWDRINKVKELSNYKINILSNSVDFLEIDKNIKVSNIIELIESKIIERVIDMNDNEILFKVEVEY